MNKIRRKALQEIFDKLSALSDELESIKEEEDESRENMPEACQGRNAMNSPNLPHTALMKRLNLSLPRATVSKAQWSKQKKPAGE